MDVLTIYTSLLFSCLVPMQVYMKIHSTSNVYGFKVDYHQTDNNESVIIESLNIRPTTIGVRTEDVQCRAEERTMTCKTLPTVIPPDITNVIVTSQDQAISEHQFEDVSWMHVDSLYIRGDKFNFSRGYMFKGLSNLSVLFLNVHTITQFDLFCFAGLDNLKNMSLCGMNTLDGNTLQLAMAKHGMLPKLKYFALNSLDKFRAPFLKLESYFWDSFVNRSLECLNLSNIIFEATIQEILVLFIRHRLQCLNLTGSFVIVDNSDAEKYLRLSDDKHTPLVQTIDTSSLRTSIIGPSVFQHILSFWFLYAKHWYAEGMYLEQRNFQDEQNFSTYRMFLETFVFVKNNIQILNVTYILPRDNKLRHVDFSSNKIEYLGSGVFISGFALKELILSNNRLFCMERMPEFQTLLKPLKNLTYVNLAYNNISFIPTNMFVSNILLEKLVLTKNSLKTISFELEQLNHLRLLDIRGNMIKFLQTDGINRVQSIFIKRRKKLRILFQGNPAECTCQTKRFIAWLSSIQSVSYDIAQCSYEGSTIEINSAAVGKCEFLCKRTMIISVSVTCSLVAIVTCLLVVMKTARVRKRHKMKNVELMLIESIRKGAFACFVAVSGNDEASVNKLVLTNLRRYFRTKVMLERDVVCTGYRFRPGFPVSEESYRLLKMSHVFLAVVSDAFMRSPYCKLELQEACKQDKPTILVFLGRLDTEDMPKYMQEVFKRNSRAWIKQSADGSYYTEPSLDEICDAIWDLAVANFQNQDDIR